MKPGVLVVFVVRVVSTAPVGPVGGVELLVPMAPVGPVGGVELSASMALAGVAEGVVPVSSGLTMQEQRSRVRLHTGKLRTIGPLSKWASTQEKGGARDASH